MTLALEPRALPRVDTAVRLSPGALAAVFGGVIGLAVGFAYLGGTAARATEVRAQAERLQGAEAAGFTEEALAAAAGGLDESALTIARRHDPYMIAGSAQRDRQAAWMTARLEQLRATSDSQAAGLRQASLTAGPAALPFSLGGSLEASRDLDCLTQAVYYEARGEGRAGMQAVAQVVLNRARHPAFPKTVCGVVFQGAARRTGCQFSFTCSGAMRARVNSAAWNRSRAIASAALSGQVHAAVGNATHFHTTAVSPGWRGSLVRVGQVGSHVFYRFGGRSGAGSAFSYQPRRSGSEGQFTRASTASPSEPTLLDTADAPVSYEAVVAQDVGSSAAATATTEPPAPTSTTPVVVEVSTLPQA